MQETIVHCTNTGVTPSWSWLPMDTRIGFLHSSIRNLLANHRYPEVSRSWSRWSRNTTGVVMMAYDILTNGLMLSQCFTMFLRSLSICQIFVFLCPLGINFGIMWRQWNGIAGVKQVHKPYRNSASTTGSWSWHQCQYSHEKLYKPLTQYARKHIWNPHFCHSGIELGHWTITTP